MPIWSRYYNVDPALGARCHLHARRYGLRSRSLGVYNLAAANEARFEGARRVSEGVYSPSDSGGAPIDPDTMYLLMEPAAENKEYDSRSVTPPGHSGVNCSAAGMPDIFGGTNGVLCTETAGAGLHLVYSDPTINWADPGECTFTVWIYPGTRRYVYADYGSATDSFTCIIDTVNKVITDTRDWEEVYLVAQD